MNVTQPTKKRKYSQRKYTSIAVNPIALRLAKSALSRMLETKRCLTSTNSSTKFTDTWYYLNLTYQIALGTTDQDRVGSKITYQGIKLRGQLIHTTALTRTPTFRYMLVQSDNQLGTTTAGTLGSYTDLFVTSSNSALPGVLIPDTNKVRVILDRTRNTNPGQTSTVISTCVNHYAKYVRKCEYMGATGYVKGGNVYLVWNYEDQGGAQNYAFGWDIEQLFKDG